MFQLVKEGIIICEVEASGDDPQYMDRSSNTIIVHLNAGQRVWPQRQSGTATKLSSDYRSAFTGALIQTNV